MKEGGSGPRSALCIGFGSSLGNGVIRACFPPADNTPASTHFHSTKPLHDTRLRLSHSIPRDNKAHQYLNSILVIA